MVLPKCFHFYNQKMFAPIAVQIDRDIIYRIYLNAGTACIYKNNVWWCLFLTLQRGPDKNKTKGNILKFTSIYWIASQLMSSLHFAYVKCENSKKINDIGENNDM